MAKLIKHGELVADDWTSVADDAPVPSGKVILSAARLREEGDRLHEEEHPLGVRLGPGEEVESVADLLPRVALVALVFEKFTDGRHYTTARLLRERYGFSGEIRAVGEVLRDQLLLMRRCGIDAFELAAGKDAEDALQAFGEFTVRYQPALDEPWHIFRRRVALAAAQ